MYRLIADTGGAFVQPALYEAFGLTVVEVPCHLAACALLSHLSLKCQLTVVDVNCCAVCSV